MDERAELIALRRMAELEAKAGGAAAEVEDPGFLHSALIGSGRTFDRIGKGVRQLYYGATGNQAKQAELASDAATDDALYKPLQEARPWATGIGEALPSMVLPGAGGASLLANAGRMALAGAAPGLLEYGSAEDRIKRGAIGATAGTAVPLAGAAFKTGKSLVEPLYVVGRSAIAGRTLNRAAGDGAAAARMARAAPLVPGSMPTAAQVAESGGIAALERSAAAANPEAYTQRAMEQSSARLSALRSIAGDDAAMAAAKTTREATAGPLYAAADAGVAPIDSYFSGLMKRFPEAVKQAQTLARKEGLDDIFFRNADGTPKALLGEGAHFIKKALDEAAEFGSSSYTGKASAAAAGKTNDLFQQWLAKSIPEYGAAKQAFAKGSAPINQMQVGQSLLDAASPALNDFGALGRETGATYARALRNADQTAAKATGKSGAKMADVLSPRQMAMVENVAKDLARKTNAQDLGRGVGSDTFQKLSMQNIAEQSGMPRAVGGLLSLPGVSRATSWAYRDTDEQIKRLLAEALLDPKKAAELMRGPQGGRLPQAMRRLLGQATMRGGLLGAPSAANSVTD